MSPYDTRKKLAAYSQKLESHQPLDDDDYAYLAEVFKRFSAGENPAEVLGLKNGRGQSETDARLRRALQSAFHWIECAIQPDAEGPGLSVTEACQVGSRLVRKFLNPTNPDAYDPSYIRKCFYDPKYRYMRKTEVHSFDTDSPYPF